MHEKLYKLHIPMYRHILHVCVSTNVLMSVNKHIKNSKRTKPIRAVHIELESNGNSMLFLPKDIEAGEIAHECMHVVQYVMREIGAGYAEDEFVTYFLGYVVEEVTKFVEKYAKGTKTGVVENKTLVL